MNDTIGSIGPHAPVKYLKYEPGGTMIKDNVLSFQPAVRQDVLAVKVNVDEPRKPW